MKTTRENGILNFLARTLVYSIFFMFFFSSVYAINDNVSQIYDLTFDQDGDTGPLAIEFNTQTVVDSAYSHSTGAGNSRLHINQSGLYKLSYACTWKANTTTSRHIMRNWIRENGVTDITPSQTVCYNRNNGDGDQCSNSASLFYNVTSPRYVELMGDKLQGSGGITFNSNDCFLTAQKVSYPVIQVYDDLGGENITLAGIVQNLSATSTLNSSIFARVNSTTINVSEDGWYRVSFQACAEQRTNNGGSNIRQTIHTQLLRNSNLIIHVGSKSYTRESGSGDRNCEEGTTLVDLNSGDTLSMQRSIYARDSVETVDTIQDHSWLLVEYMNTSNEMQVYENAGGQAINSLTKIDFDTQLKSGNFTDFDLVTDQFRAGVDGLYEVSYQFGWQDGAGGRVIACAGLELNNVVVKPSFRCDYTRGRSTIRDSSVGSTVLVNMSRSDVLEVVANATRSVTTVGNETWLLVRKVDQNPQVFYDQSNLNLGAAVINTGNLSTLHNITSYRNNTAVNVTCISGDCSQIGTPGHSTIASMLNANTNALNFSCSDSTIGTYEARFKVNSSEYPSGDFINVSCQIFTTVGVIDTTLLDPIPGSTRRVGQNREFTIRANISCIGDPSVTCGNVTSYARYQSVFGSGADGDRTITSANSIVNNYTYLSNDETTADNIISVNSSSEFVVGDEIMLHQTQNGTGTGIAGTYEFRFIVAINGNNFTLDTNLENNFASGTYNSTAASVTQIIKVPQYSRIQVNSGASITAKAWDGFSGGIVVLRAQEHLNTSSGGYVNVSLKGYRGGDCNGCGNAADGDQGESYLGLGIASLSNNANGGGGGFGPSGLSGEPGAGGGHATAGGLGDSTNDATGGSVIGDVNLTRIYFGGGGGAGGDDDNLNPPAQYTHGGGAALVFARTTISANILAQGDDAFGAGGGAGVAGAGAGGTIWLIAENMTLNDVNASGGAEFDDGGDLGGAGGDGRVRLDYNSISGTTDPNSGFNGSLSGTVGFKYISTTIADVPFWTSSSQPSWCVLDGNQSCITTWSVNATGPIGTIYLIDVFSNSNLSIIPQNTSRNATINITNVTAPVITLLLPPNGSKIISNGTVNFTWNIDSTYALVNCSLFLNGSFFSNHTCNGNGNTSMTITLDYGEYIWSINATDADNETTVSTNFTFLLLRDRHILVSKSIRSINTDQYLINLSIQNRLINFTRNFTGIDFKDQTFMGGSFSPPRSFTNSTSGPRFIGDIYGWDFIISNSSTQRFNYSISGMGDYYVSRAYVVGIG